MADLPFSTSEHPDALSLSASLCSRLCHDLINPVGALSSGLEALDDPGTEESVRTAAFDLVRSGSAKAVALLSHARLAYGLGGSFGEMISPEEARNVLEALYATTKAGLVWNLGTGPAPRDSIKVLLVLAHAATDCIPRGGTVTVDGSVCDFTMTVTGKKTYLQPPLVRALEGNPGELTGRFVPAYIAALLARAGGGSISACHTGDTVTFRACTGSPEEGTRGQKAGTRQSPSGL